MSPLRPFMSWTKLALPNTILGLFSRSKHDSEQYKSTALNMLESRTDNKVHHFGTRLLSAHAKVQLSDRLKNREEFTGFHFLVTKEVI